MGDHRRARRSLSGLAAYRPQSEALYHLADDALRETTRGPDVWAWVDEVFEDLGCPKPSREDFRWIATYSMVQQEWSPEDAENLIRFLSSLALDAQIERQDLDEWNLLSKYRLDDVELDDGMDLDWARILEEFRRDTKPALLERFARYFASGPDGHWVPGVFGPVTGCGGA